MIPERIATAITEFVSGCKEPALLERGERPIPLTLEGFRLDVSARGTWLEAWDEARVWSRKIVRVGEASSKKLELEASRFGKRNVTVTLVDAADARSAPAIEKTRRSVLAEQFRMFLRRQYGGWKWEAFRSEAKLENSWSPVYPTALLTRGNQAVAALAAPDRDTSFHALTFALVWLDWIRKWHGEVAAGKLVLYLPERHARSVILLARELDAKKVTLEIWMYAEDGAEYRVDPADCGNLESTLSPRYSRLMGPAWWMRLIGNYPEIDAVEEADGSISYRVRGLEFGRLRGGGGNELPLLRYGLKRRKVAREEDRGAIEGLIRTILELRRPEPADRMNPVYLGEPERWLEAQVRRNLPEVDACLETEWLYGQALGSLHGERSALDLLGVDLAGRLAIVELKASEDIHLPLQAFDYWLRVRQHLRNGDFAGSGYFPGKELNETSPRVLLVLPCLHFHPMTEAVMHWLPPECEIVRIGLNGDWRQRIDVVLRM